MCGIFGAVNSSGYFNREDYGNFVNSTDIVNYRGPDAGGYVGLNSRGSNPLSGNKFNVFLGHKRLSIIDLSSAGNQPFTDNNGLWIIYNGEIFNYIELKEELKRRGHRFYTKTDTEVILGVYREYGEGGFCHLNGMWAFALVDLSNERVVLSRDRFSIKPLYIHQSRDKIFFSSEIKQLLTVVKNREVNNDVMYKYLKQGLIDYNNETFFEDIHKVKPMHNVVIDLRTRKLEETRYWDYFDEEVPAKDNELTEYFRELFIDSVRIRLRSDVPVACLLSGGLDSSGIAVIADRFSDNGIKCFSIVSDNKKYSEEKFINCLENKRGLNVEKILFRGGVAWDYIEKVLWHQDEPVGGFTAVAHNYMMELIKAHSDIKVILSGQGGDETLCGYKKFFFFYLKEAFRRKHFLDLIQNAFLSFIYRTVIWQFSISGAKRYIRHLQVSGSDPLDKVLQFNTGLEPIWRHETLRSRQALDIDRYSVPELTHYEDRNSMAYSMEIRLPFLDYRLVNFVLNIPDSMKIRHGWTKYILRKAINELPREIAWRRDKQPFLIPEERWIKYDFKDRIEELFGSSKLHDIGLINKNELLKTYRDFIRGNRLIFRSDIVRFIMAEIWLRMFIL
ncbi:asparagine synthetase [glutamine-hydrolyzing] 1 [bacterium BMS3Bbin06]|nr:asparagine synthetase [glutamine-hydrolyzing] 1 [bacterium BMS3Bbin06]